MEYELTLASTGKGNNFDVQGFDKIRADGLVSLLSQFVVLVASLHRRELEEELRNAIGRGPIPDDDIPF